MTARRRRARSRGPVARWGGSAPAERDIAPHEVVSIGDHVEALVLRREDADGRLILSMTFSRS
ncbi:hypothetical protein GCM10010191_74530 [Actinomadura vinacea]|uniref:S1 RNA-binding domain-containing protein n=1 Tax=Actinomadura vinacea TaxID=115336 RepID=A0ABN3K192_9ACTN